MKTFFCTYADKNFKNSKKKIIKEANDFGFDFIFDYDRDDLPESFIKESNGIIDKEKGGGYWLWKPWVLINTLNAMNNNDVLVYLDAGCKINIKAKKRFREYLELAKKNKGTFAFYMPGLIECNYTADKVFKYFNIDYNSNAYTSEQFVGGVIIIIKNDFTVKLVESFYESALRKSELFDDYDIESSCLNFKAHRHDQSVFSIIRKVNNIYSIPNETHYPDLINPIEYPFWAIRRKDFSYLRIKKAFLGRMKKL